MTSEAAQPTFHGNRFSSALTTEVGVHRVLLLTVFLPFVLGFIPYQMFHFASAIIIEAIAHDFHGDFWGDAPWQVSDNYSIVFSVFLLLAVILLAVRSYRKHLTSTNIDTSRRFLPLRGKRQQELLDHIATEWNRLPRQNPPPAVVWFPLASPAARAMLQDGRPTIAVSIALWEGILKPDPLCRAILLHEMAHLAECDPIWFRRYGAIRDATRGYLNFVRNTLYCLVLFFCVQFMLGARGRHFTTISAIRQLLMIVCVGALITTAVPVARGILNRYLALLSSLMELRADVYAAEWMDGPAELASLLSATPLVHRSSTIDRVRSLVSFSLTHLSESERIEFLGDARLLMLPKVRYFSFSLLLALAISANGLTYFIVGGFFDWLVVLATAIALGVTMCTQLLLCGMRGQSVSFKSLLRLGASLVLFQIFCQKGLADIAYLLQTFAVSLGLPSDGVSLSLKDVTSDLSTTWQGYAELLAKLWSHGWLLGTLALEIAVLYAFILLSSYAAQWRRGNWPATILGIFMSLGLAVDASDAYRCDILKSTWLDPTLLGWTSAVIRFPALHFCLGALLSLAALLLLLAFSRLPIVGWRSTSNF